VTRVRLLRSTTAVLCAAVVLGCTAQGSSQQDALNRAQPTYAAPLPAGAAAVPASTAATPQSDQSCNPTASLRPVAPPAPVPPPAPASAGPTLAKIVARGRVVVGVDQNTYLFGFRNPKTGLLEGFDIDVAREMARGIFGDPDKIQFQALTSAQRIPPCRAVRSTWSCGA